MTDQFNASDSPSTDQSAAYVTAPITVPASGSVTLQWEAICHAANYLDLPCGVPVHELVAGRQPGHAGLGHAARQQLGRRDPGLDHRTCRAPASRSSPTPTPAPPGPRSLLAGPRRCRRTPTSCPGSRTPTSFPRLEAVGITAVGDDASKAYPNPPDDEFGIGVNYTGADVRRRPDLRRRHRPGGAPAPDQHLLQRLHRGPGGRRVQHALPPRRLAAQCAPRARPRRA